MRRGLVQRLGKFSSFVVVVVFDLVVVLAINTWISFFFLWVICTALGIVVEIAHLLVLVQELIVVSILVNQHTLLLLLKVCEYLIELIFHGCDIWIDLLLFPAIIAILVLVN